MSGRYIHNVKPGERWDPTMTGVEDVMAFHEGDYIRSRSGLAHIFQIDEAPFGKLDTRFIHVIDVRDAAPGALIHDVRENDVCNFYYNGMLSDGRVPADVMTFDAAQRIYEQTLHDATCS